MLKKLFSDTAIYGLAPQIPKVVSIFVLPIITSHLTALDFGVYGVITSVVTGISVLATLGLNLVLSNSFFKDSRYEWTWRQIYGILILWNIPYSILLSAIIYFFIPEEVLYNAWGIILSNVLPVVFFGPTALIGNLYYQLHRKPLQIASRATVFGILTIFLNLYFIAAKDMGYMGWFLSSAVSQMLTQLSFFIPLNFKHKIKPIFKFNKPFLKKSLKVALPTVPHSYGTYLLNTSDRLVMKVVNVSTGDIGLYNAAYTVSNVIRLVSNASGQAATPLMLKSYKDDNEHQARKIIFALQVVFLAGTFICSVWLKEAFYLLIKNDTLRQVYPLGVIVVMANSYRPMYLGANNRLFFSEKTKILLKITFIAGISNVLLNFALIPVFGYQVAAYTTYAGLMYMGYSGFFMKEFKQAVTLNYYPLLWLIITLVMTAIAFIAVDMSYMYKIALTILTAVLAFVAHKKFNSK